MSLNDVSERLARQKYTPSPAIKGVCGFPTPSGVFATIQYRCECGAIRCQVLSVVVGATYTRQLMWCLKCQSNRMVFERIDIGAIHG